MDQFVVSARKYRPITFASVVGQGHVTQTLQNAILRNQLAHAYLFCGPRGVGKTTCARIFAKAINCLSPVNGEACNVCESCRSFNEGRSFTIHELDAASNNSVDDIRSLTEQVRIPPQVGRYSVYIIDEVHMLSLSAFNAFLKTLEEPPAHAVFILATTEKQKIIPTILSRCQIYDFNRIKVEDSVVYLRQIAENEGVVADEESLHIIAQKAEGGMRDALSMFDQVVSFCGNTLTSEFVSQTLNILDYNTYFRITDLILAGNYPDLLLLFDEVLRRGFGAQAFVGGLNSHFRNLLVSRDPHTLPLLEVTGTIATRYVEQSTRCEVNLLFETINLLTEVDATFRQATNQRLHIELALLKLSGLGQKKNISTASQLVLPEPLLSKSPEIESVASVATTQSVASIPTGAFVATTQSVASIPAGASVATTQFVASIPAGASEEISASGAFVRSVPPPVPLTPNPQISAEEAQMVPGTMAEFRAEGGVSIVAPLTSVALAPVLSAESEGAQSKSIPAEISSVSDEKQSALSGISIRNMLKSKTLKPSSRTGEGVSRAATLESEEEPVIDEDAEDRIRAACLSLSEELMRDRPRLGCAFRNVIVAKNVVHFKVPNQPLQEEIFHSKLELQKMLVERAEVECAVEFKVTVEVDHSFIKPIKVDDKVKYFTGMNENFGTLCKALGLYVD